MDEDDEEEVGTIILALLQKERRRLRPTGGGNLTIGYDIFKVTPCLLCHTSLLMLLNSIFP